ncbi:MAG: LysM peptidoglycan-binding domain-containing protein, partial [Lachnospiraceae bacterium]|nr:LysM peptidoglycan-binding domain-containing protein [Lachnospiraceae bacterium]
VTGTNINIDVTISDYVCEENGGYGNKDYSIEFERYKYLKIYTTDELKIVKFVKQIKTRPASPPAAATRTYTIVSGDNLWKIARKFYGGSGSDWQKIYNANRSVIESTAIRYRGGRGSDNGHWIYPGCVLTIP